MRRHAIPDQVVERGILLLPRALTLPVLHAGEALGQTLPLLLRQRPKGLAAHHRHPTLVAVPTEREVEVHPRELLRTDLLQRRRAAAHHAFRVQLDEGCGLGTAAPHVEGTQLQLGDRVVAQKNELLALQRPGMGVGEVAGHDVQAFVPEGEDLPPTRPRGLTKRRAQFTIERTVYGSEIGEEER